MKKSFFMIAFFISCMLSGCIHKEKEKPFHDFQTKTRSAETPIVLIHGLNSDENAWGSAKTFSRIKNTKMLRHSITVKQQMDLFIKMPAGFTFS